MARVFQTTIKLKKYDLTDKERLHNILVEYQFFAKKVMKILEGSYSKYTTVDYKRLKFYFDPMKTMAASKIR